MGDGSGSQVAEEFLSRCDGQAYGNACEAAAAGINVAHAGVCSSPVCQDNNDCSIADYCIKAVGDCGGAETCGPRPDSCSPIYEPVCGCDGGTYGNECNAAAAGVNVAHSGECPSARLPLFDCAIGQHCVYAVGACAGSGQCEAIPQNCPDVWIPVCRCDGRTYSNSCFAAAVGMSILDGGACPP